MPTLRDDIDKLLPWVETPAQYTGGEVNSIRKDPSSVDLSWCLVFPDAYSVGMSHLGLRILYGLLNGLDWCLAERSFTPWPDMAGRMREAGVPAFSLESHRPLREFDVLGFSLQYEMCLTNVLETLELAGIPLASDARGDDDPIIIGGGPVAFNPEPCSAVFDVLLVGEGEEWIVEASQILRDTRGGPRRERLLRLAREVPGSYVPSLYDVTYNDDGTVAAVTPTESGVPETVDRRVVADLENAFSPTAQIVPFVETVHDRLTIEVMRGCPNSCRFCQAGCSYRPVRSRSAAGVLELAKAGIASTGWEEIGLCSLSISDHPELAELLGGLNEEFAPRGVSISLPSLRVGDRLADMPAATSAVRKTGITIAPETGSERLRKSVNKRITNEDLFAGVDAAYEAGYDRIKLYFMIGIPGETDEDVASIADLATEVSFRRKRFARSAGKVNVTVSPFVPKAQTPFQWEASPPIEELERRRSIVIDNLRSRSVRVRTTDPRLARLESVFARGDRRVGAVLAEAHRLGCRFDAWGEQFKPELWDAAFASCGVDAGFYCERQRGDDETLPWSHISGGVGPERLAKERDAARAIAAEES